MKTEYKIKSINKDKYNIIKITTESSDVDTYKTTESIIFMGSIIECYCYLKLEENNYLTN